MSYHHLMLLALGGDAALVALSAAQLAAEIRWRRRTAPTPSSNPIERTSSEGTP
ncbi:hypothetical protein ACFTZF_01135 [Streptomyces mirabilis]|uniref:hypothetical protein n=1 Tax=Streptomyces mirabilis TaxID=68239 RepID=UPI00363ABA4C